MIWLGKITVGADASVQVGFHGSTPVADAAHIPDPSGGATVDAEAQAAIDAILVAVEGKGLVAGGTAPADILVVYGLTNNSKGMFVWMTKLTSIGRGSSSPLSAEKN